MTSPITVDQPARLTPDQASAVAELAERARLVDGVGPLSEESRLGLAHPGTHRLVTGAEGAVVGYGVVVDGTAEIVVDPEHRRRGVGRALLAATREAGADLVWAHGDLPAARALLAGVGAVPERTLYVLQLSLGDLPTAVVPEGYLARTFTAPDRDAVLRVNARAFAHHPEQGSLDAAGFEERAAQSWFDPTGLILVEDVSADPPTLAAFHWTKVDEAETGAGTGEVYVVGVDPDHQGRGLGRPLTLLGLDALRARGLTRAILYVDGDNTAAIRTYRSLGFTDAKVDVRYRFPAN